MPTAERLHLGALLDQVILDNGLVAKDLAAACGISQEELSRFRKGRKDTATDVLIRILCSLPPDIMVDYWSKILVWCAVHSVHRSERISLVNGRE